MALLKEINKRPSLAGRGAAKVPQKAGLKRGGAETLDRKAKRQKKEEEEEEEEEEDLEDEDYEEEEEEEEEDSDDTDDDDTDDEYQDELHGAIDDAEFDGYAEEEPEKPAKKAQKPKDAPAKKEQPKGKGKEVTKGKEQIPASTESAKKKRTKPNKVLLLSTRGIINRHRHLLKDFHKLMPHCRKENKLDSKSKLFLLTELAELHSCNYCVFFESRKREDLYLWVARLPEGPSMKFHIQNVHNMEELQMTGNCLKGSRPLLSFDANFDSQPHYQLMKEVFTQVFGTPKGHPKSKPFFDHVLSFSIADNRIWFRNYQITEDLNEEGHKDVALVEVGPRFVLNPIRVFAGTFGGPTLYQNHEFVSPNDIRREMYKTKVARETARKEDKTLKHERKSTLKIPENPLDSVFE